MEDFNEQSIAEYIAVLEEMSAPDWDKLPDIGLYMDQVISYLTRLIEPFYALHEDHKITPAMINNYAKANVIPRAEGKKYSQEHLALLIMIMTLKKSLSVQDIRTLLDEQTGETTHRNQYERYQTVLDVASKSVAAEIRTELAGLKSENPAARIRASEKLRELALKLSLEGSIRSLAAERIINLIR